MVPPGPGQRGGPPPAAQHVVVLAAWISISRLRALLACTMALAPVDWTYQVKGQPG
jgi:hypothetical protein